MLPHILARENASMGTPILAILAAGLPASLLACACPLWLLVRVMCVGPLVDHAVMAATVIHKRYQPHTGTATGQLLLSSPSMLIYIYQHGTLLLLLTVFVLSMSLVWLLVS